MPAQPASPIARSAAPGSARARLRLGAVVLLGLLAALYLVLAALLSLTTPSGSAVAGGLVRVALTAAALTYGALAWAVVRQSRAGHIAATVVCALGAVLSLSAAMAWTDWATFAVNLAALAMLLASVPRRAASA